ncbi:MAG: hypothetical protein PSV36_04490 [Algoriphagus sp.]|nr:hypothetical protein [Algoriphagus sp.]
MNDSLNQISESVNQLANQPSSQDYSWEPYVLIVASLSLFAAVIIPFAEKKYEERKTKKNFRLYIKKQLGEIYNFLIVEKIDYHDMSIKNNPTKNQISLLEFTKRINQDFTEHKNSVQPRIIFSLLINIENIMRYSHNLRHLIDRASLDKLTDRTLEHGGKLSDEELKKVYGLFLILENFVPISLFHDKFGELKSIKRIIENDVWIGLKLEPDLIKNQQVLNDDLLLLNDNEKSILEVNAILNIVENKLMAYYGEPGK